MRLLVVSPFQPHPAADHGGAVYLGTLLDALLQHADVALVHFAHQGEPPALPGVRSYPVPRLRNAELTRAQLRRQRLRLGADWGLRGLPLVVAKHRSTAFRDRLRRAVDEVRPDAALVEFAVMAQYLPDLAGVRTVLTDHEAGCSLPDRLGPGDWGLARDRRLWRRYVRRFYPLAGVCQALSAADAAHLETLCGRTVLVRPPLVEVPATAADPAATGPALLFLGNYLHHPNTGAARLLAEEVLPLIRAEVPDAVLRIAGPHAPPAVRALARHPGVEVLGYVDDLTGLLGRSRCLVAPVLSGAGVRIKVLSALAHGVPVVANRLGLQGIDPPGGAVAVAETPQALAAACVGFLADAGRAATAGAAARRFVQETMSGAILVEQQLARIRALDPNPPIMTEEQAP